MLRTRLQGLNMYKRINVFEKICLDWTYYFQIVNFSNSLLLRTTEFSCLFSALSVPGGPDFSHLFHLPRPSYTVLLLWIGCSGYLQLVFFLTLNGESFLEEFLRLK